MKTSRMMRGLILSVAFITLLIQGSVLQAQTSCCTGKNKPVKIEFTYTGESCSATSSHQDSDKYGCSGDPQDDQSVYIVAANKSYLPSALIWFSGTVSIDSSFVIDAANAGESRLKGETYIQVFDQQNGTKLQEVYFHTSCSQPLIAGDQYGSIYLKGILLENGNTCGTFEDDEDPNESCCVDGFKPADISLIYTGESCSATNTTQASDKFNCYGNPNSASSVYIIANNNNDPTQGDKWFEGSVQLDSVFTIHASLSGATKLSSNTVIHIFASQGGTLLQRVNFHTSCSQPLSIGDQWGSVQLYGMRGEQGGTCGTVDDVDDSNESCCVDGFKPAQLSLQYTGEDCSGTSTSQSSDKYNCSGDPNDANAVYVIANNDDNASNGDRWFEGWVLLDSTFTLDASNAGATKLSSNTVIHIFDHEGGSLLQKVNFHTSCSQPLDLDDQWGALKLVGMVGEDGSTCGNPSTNPEPICNRELINTTSCVGRKFVLYMIDTTGKAYWLEGDSTSYSWTEFSNGTVLVKGENFTHADLSSESFDFEVLLSGATSTAPSGSPKYNYCGAISSFANWVYFQHVSGVVTSSTRGVFTLSLRGPAFQQGMDANTNQLGYGASGWFHMEGGDGFFDKGDINAMLSTECSTIKEPESCCVDGFKPKQISLTYTGEGCSATQTTQSSDKYGCYGDPSGRDVVYIVANNDNNPSNGDRWFEGWVLLDSVFTIDANFADKDYLSSNTVVHIFDFPGGSVLQRVNFHTSCSQPLITGDQWGAVQLEGMVSKYGDTCGTPHSNPEPTCERELKNTTSCVGRKFVLYLIDSTGTAFWLEGDSTSYHWQEYNNGMVHLTGEGFTHASLSGDEFAYDIWLLNATSTAPSGSPKSNYCGTISSYSDWTYFNSLVGTVTSDNHGTFSLSRRGPAFQQGTDANTNQLGYGASGWFYLHGGDGYFTDGDINAMLSETCQEDEVITSCCVDGYKPQQVTLTYTGESCSATSTTQDSDKYNCTGDPDGRDLVYIIANDKNNPADGKIWFTGWVIKDSSFTLNALELGEDYLKSNTVIHVYDQPNGSLLQRVNFHTSCSQPLNIGDQWGAVKLRGMISEEGASCGYPSDNPVPVCDRELKNTTSCVGRKFVLYMIDTTGTSYWLDGDSTSYSWEEYSNGTVVLSGSGFTHSAFSGEEFSYHIVLTEATTTPPASSPKTNYCGTISDMSDWVYFKSMVGTVTSSERGVFTLSRRGPAFQQGTDANTNQLGYGASGWFFMEGGDGFFDKGDINAMLSEECKTPVESCCTGGMKPQRITFKYTGDGCDATVTSQSSDKYGCSGDPNNRETVYIIANEKENISSGHIWFEGEVRLGALFEIDATNDGETRLKGNTYLHIYDQQGGTKLQTVYFHTSCSQPIYTGDQYGAAIITGIVFENGSTCGNPLPVELVNFNGHRNEDQIDLRWSTASEQNNDRFELERSLDGFEFRTIAKIPSKAPGGTSLDMLNYKYTDYSSEILNQEVVFYRLKQVDFDGELDYSNIVAVRADAVVKDIDVFPNPADGTIWVQFNSNYQANTIVRLISTTGQELYSKEYTGLKDADVIPVELDDLDRGLYYLQVISGTRISTTPVVIERK